MGTWGCSKPGCSQTTLNGTAVCYYHEKLDGDLLRPFENKHGHDGYVPTFDELVDTCHEYRRAGSPVVVGEG